MPLTYSLVSNTHSQYFAINTTSGVLYYSVDYICSFLSPDVANLTIRISDQYGGYSDANIAISISHVNTRPIASNLHANITVHEFLVTGSWLYTVNLYDPDAESMTCRYLFTPSSATSTFQITQTGKYI